MKTKLTHMLRGKEKKKREKIEKIKGNSSKLQKPHVEGEVYNNNKKCDNIHIHIYTHKLNQNSPTKIKYNRLTRQTKETKNYIYQNKTN